MTIPEEAVEAAEKKIVQAITGFVHEHKTISSEELTKDVLTAALPSIEKEIRAQVAREIRAHPGEHPEYSFARDPDYYEAIEQAAQIAKGEIE